VNSVSFSALTPFTRRAFGSQKPVSLVVTKSSLSEQVEEGN